MKEVSPLTLEKGHTKAVDKEKIDLEVDSQDDLLNLTQKLKEEIELVRGSPQQHNESDDETTLATLGTQTRNVTTQTPPIRIYSPVTHLKSNQICY